MHDRLLVGGFVCLLLRNPKISKYVGQSCGQSVCMFVCMYVCLLARSRPQF